MAILIFSHTPPTRLLINPFLVPMNQERYFMDAYSYPQQQQQQQQQEQQQQSQSQQQQQQQQIQSNFQVQSVLSPYNNIGNENIPRQRSTMLEFLDDEARRKLD